MINYVDKLKAFFSKLVNDMRSNKKLAVCICAALAGVVLIAVSETDISKDKKTYVNADTTEYQQYSQEVLKKELAEFLENIDGAGRVEVMINYESTQEKIYACDTSENISKSDEEKQERNYKSEHIIIKTDGNENGLTVKEIYPKIRGIAVVCDGGNNSVIKEQITSTLCALFNINSTRISVASMAD